MILSAKHRRLALEQLDHERLLALCSEFAVRPDARQRRACIDALIRSRKVDFSALLGSLKSGELRAICLALGLNRSGAKALLVATVLSRTEPAPVASSATTLMPSAAKEARRRPPPVLDSRSRRPSKQRLVRSTVSTAQVPLSFHTDGRASPFVKWVGGKRQLLRALSPHVPNSFGTYFEPFVGGGALFFHLGPHRAVLADSNERLIRAYRGVKNSVERVIAILRGYPHTKAFYLELRERQVDSCSDEEVAAWLIYLNKTGYNGLYRVNSRNVFNVPYGNYERPNYCDEDTLRACAHRLQSAELELGDFESTTSGAREGDFVYFDPPYVPRSLSSYFTSYTATGFGLGEQERLRDVALRLKRRGVKVILSNSATTTVEKLYSGHFQLEPVLAKRRVNSDIAARGAVTEYLII